MVPAGRRAIEAGVVSCCDLAGPTTIVYTGHTYARNFRIYLEDDSC